MFHAWVIQYDGSFLISHHLYFRHNFLLYRKNQSPMKQCNKKKIFEM